MAGESLEYLDFMKNSWGENKYSPSSNQGLTNGLFLDSGKEGGVTGGEMSKSQLKEFDRRSRKSDRKEKRGGDPGMFEKGGAFGELESGAEKVGAGIEFAQGEAEFFASDTSQMSGGQKTMQVATKTLSAAATGASIGGPWGAAVGAAYGLTSSLIKQGADKKKARNAANEKYQEGFDATEIERERMELADMDKQSLDNQIALKKKQLGYINSSDYD